MTNATRIVDLDRLEELIEDTPECRLICIDPVSAYCGQADTHKNSDVRAMLAPLSDLASRRRVAIIAVAHLNKSGAGKAVYRTQGSLAFNAAARAVWAVSKDKDDPTRRLLLPVKLNVTPDTTGLAYSIVDGVIAWERNPVAMTADEAFEAESEERGSGLSEAEDWLRSFLSDGPKRAGEVQKSARNDGISTKSLRTAREKICDKPYKSNFDGGWVWELRRTGLFSEDALEGAQGALSQEGAPRAPSGHLGTENQQNRENT